MQTPYKALTHDLPIRDQDFATQEEAVRWLQQQALNGRVMEQRGGEYWTVAVLKSGCVMEEARNASRH